MIRDKDHKEGSYKNVWYGLGRQRIEIPKKILKSRVQGNSLLKHLHICSIGYYPKAKDHYTYRKKGLPLLKNVRIGKKGMKLDNDVTFRFDFSLRDDATANSKLDQGTSFGTAGQKVIRIAPSIDYVLNNRVSLKFYFEQNKNIPKISNAFPITNTRAGLQVRISLAQ